MVPMAGQAAQISFPHGDGRCDLRSQAPAGLRRSGLDRDGFDCVRHRGLSDLGRQGLARAVKGFEHANLASLVWALVRC